MRKDTVECDNGKGGKPPGNEMTGIGQKRKMDKKWKNI